MKKTILTAAIAFAALFGTSAYAETGAVQLGVKGGVNLSNFTGDINGNKAKAGFNVGVTLDYQLAPSIYLLSGLEYTTKGTKGGDGSDVKINLGYMQLPIHIAYKTPISQGTNLVLHAGPYLAYATNGNLKTGGVSYDIFNSNVVGKADQFKRFDAGLGIGAGLEFGKIAVGLGVDFGLIDIDKSSNSSLKNISSNLSVGYKF